MQGKGLIITFVTALIAVCAYQLLFTFSAYRVESRAVEYAKTHVLGGNTEIVAPADLNPTAKAAYIDSVGKELRSFKSRYLDSVANETALNIVVAEYNYAQVKERQISLGLDLQGGMSVVLQVSLEELVRAMANDSQDPTFLKALENAKKSMTSTQENFVTLFGNEFQKLDPGAKLAAIFATPENKDKINFNSTNEQVLAVLKNEADGAVERTFNIIRSRIDEFGVTQPNINLQEATGRIIVELPGVENAERARKLLQATAQLEFWEVWDNREVFNYFVSANDVLATMLAVNDTTVEDSTLAALTGDSTTTTAIAETTTTTDSLSSETEDTTALNALMDDDTTGKSSEDLMDDAEIKKKFPLFSNGSILKPATGQDADGQYSILEGPVVGYAYTSDKNKVMEYLEMEKVRAAFPKNIKFVWGSAPLGTSGNLYGLYALKTRPNDDKAPLEGDAIVDARQDIDQNGKPDVDMTMNSEGAKTWRRLTKDNIGKSIAVVLDDVVYTAPTVQGEISGGRSQITGNFSIKEAKDLANIIKAGKLPAPAQIVEEEVVGPSLGKESINAGMFSLALGFAIVILFMVFYYAGAGIITNVSLLLNMFFIMGVLASFQASLTLPGMAGIVLTIGMAVDANVIIFERIREELAKGKGLKLAISDGFSNSYSAIVDSNITSLITGFILLIIGLGPVKGFATVFVIGLFSSFITAVLCSQIFFQWYVGNKDRAIKFGTSLTNNLFNNFDFKFMEKRKVAYAISLAVLLAGFASMALRGFDLGVDFKGGRTYVVRFDTPVSTVDITGALGKEYGIAPLVRTYGSSNQVKITTAYEIDNDDKGIDSLVEAKLYNGIKGFYSNAPDFEDFKTNYRLSSVKVGPTVADDIKSSSVWASLLSILGIFIYLAIRFRRWEFGVGAILATAHDSLIILSIFSIFKGLLPFSTEIDQAFIAAMLTIIGYSVNDTVIVFDRIREYIFLHPTKSLTDNVNGAINTTLSRTTMTSFTTLLVVIVLFIFGGEVIRGFSFALLVGIVVGTYSSIFIASPVVVDLMARRKQVKK